MADKSKSPADNFIAKIVKDPKQVPDTLLLSGYLGASSEDKHTRLYFDAQLVSYVEISDDGILHTQDYPEDPLGKSYVWIKKDTVLIHGKAGTKAKFLEGPIVNDYMNVAALSQGTGTTGDSIFYCNETYQDFVCGTTKRGFLCTIVQQPTEDPGCPTSYRPYCPPPPTPNCPTRTSPYCYTRICELKLPEFEQQGAQQLGYTFPLQNCKTINSPFCPQTVIGPRCITHNSPICGYTISGAICPTHTPACFPSVNKICVTHTPVCYPSVQQICVTHTSPVCNIRTVTDPICNEAISVAGGPCQVPTPNCHGGGFPGGNPGY